MEEMTLLCEIKNFDNTIPGHVLAELQIYSTFKVENVAEAGRVAQRFYVPKNELTFYEQWKTKAIKELTQSNKNAALVQNIARRHGVILPR